MAQAQAHTGAADGAPNRGQRAPATAGAADKATPDTLPHHAILVALDASDHANGGIREAVRLGAPGRASVTGIHVYAAGLHDRRFRQMEGGLPEPYREEQVLEHQREVHNELIGRGLAVISDSYLAQAEAACADHDVAFVPCTREGKNYLELVREANAGRYDLLILGARGLGGLDGAGLGSVCERVVRRSRIDTLVIKTPERMLAEGPIVAALDGSEYAFGALRTALAFARHWQVPLHVVAAYDPHFHYVAFDRLRGVLSDEAGRIFRFDEQQRLHEDIIDSGLARIYEGHLQVARAIAAAEGVEIRTELLAGKPCVAIARYLETVRPSLLLLGKTGIHADPELDIGATTENLLRQAECAVLLSCSRYAPPLDTVTQVTTSWTHEAEASMSGVPEFARPMARMAILSYAHDRGHTVITAQIVREATARLCPQRREPVVREAAPLEWSEPARRQLDAETDRARRECLRVRAESKARAEGAAAVAVEHLRAVQQPAAASPGG
ncbi:MAG: universal stress protein [Gammaproteobacteria bacterium]|nr:universal stress protein [Gammaproteobacteria bacterium]